MRLIRTLTWSTAFAAGLFFGGVAHAQQQPSPTENGGKTTQQEDQARGGSHETEGASITGELTRVMPDQKMFSVKSASGAEMLFRYNDQTIVTGAENNVAGLATSSGAEVTVTYKNDSAGNMAQKIEVHAKR